jgi:hypothetical protein
VRNPLVPVARLIMKFSSLALLVLSPVIALATKVSRDGKCGGNNGFTCLGSCTFAPSIHQNLTNEVKAYGDCCSQYGW